MFLDSICSTLDFSILNLNFQISFQYDNLLRSICVVSFDNNQTSSPTSSTNSFILNFILLGKSFINIKNNKGPSTDL